MVVVNLSRQHEGRQATLSKQTTGSAAPITSLAFLTAETLDAAESAEVQANQAEAAAFRRRSPPKRSKRAMALGLPPAEWGHEQEVDLSERDTGGTTGSSAAFMPEPSSVDLAGQRGFLSQRLDTSEEERRSSLR